MTSRSAFRKDSGGRDLKEDGYCTGLVSYTYWAIFWGYPAHANFMRTKRAISSKRTAPQLTKCTCWRRRHFLFTSSDCELAAIRQMPCSSRRQVSTWIILHLTCAG